MRLTPVPIPFCGLSSVEHAFLWRNGVMTDLGAIGTMYNVTFYLVGGPTVLLSSATAIDCQGNISAIGVPASGGSEHSYLLLRQGAPRTCPK